MTRHQVAPDDHVAILYFSEARVDVLLFLVGLGGGQNAIEIRSVGFVLPMVLERVEVGRGAVLRGLEHGGHSGNIAEPSRWRSWQPLRVARMSYDMETKYPEI
jgi:hypothetical protein